ncbi:hypothetical protein HY449_04020 [Candidatus Pacearchaeota archaeon]|nr:hypothetical protein [Candidatus Pacearchaeota archaeon]
MKNTAKRKKKLGRGINSIENQIKLHEEKRMKAEQKGNIELKEYCEKEINALIKAVERKKKSFEKI